MKKKKTKPQYFREYALVRHRPEDALSRHILGEMSLNEVFEVMSQSDDGLETIVRKPSLKELPNNSEPFSLPTAELADV